MSTTFFLSVQIRVVLTTILSALAFIDLAVGMPTGNDFQEYATYHVPGTALGPNGEIIGRIKIGRLIGQSEVDFSLFSQRVSNTLDQISLTDSGLQVITDLNSLVLSNTNGSGGTVVFWGTGVLEPGIAAQQVSMISDPIFGVRASASVDSTLGPGVGSYITFRHDINQLTLPAQEIINVFHELGHAHAVGFGHSAPAEAGPQKSMVGTLYKLEEMENSGLVPVHRDRITENDFIAEYRQRLNLTPAQLPDRVAYFSVTPNEYLLAWRFEENGDFDAWSASLEKVNGKDEFLDYLCRN